MNTDKIILNIKALFGKRVALEKRKVSLMKIWKIQLIVGAILLVIFVGFDFWIYSNFVLKQPDARMDNERMIFKKESVERAAGKIDDYAKFLLFPTFPFVESHF